MGDDQDGPVGLLDDVGHREGLAGAGDAHEDLMAGPARGPRRPSMAGLVPLGGEIGRERERFGHHSFMRMPPENRAPLAMVILGVTMSPVISAVSEITAFSPARTVPLSLAVEDEGADPDLGLDLGALGHGQRARGQRDLSLDAALDDHVLVGLQVPGEDERRAQAGAPRGRGPVVVPVREFIGHRRSSLSGRSPCDYRGPAPALSTRLKEGQVPS